MNSWNKIAPILATAFILLAAQAGLAAEPVPSHPDDTVQAVLEEKSAKDIALASAGQFLKTTRIGKKLDVFRKSLIRRSRFEYGKTFEPSAGASGVTDSRAKALEPPGSILFAGGFDSGLSPMLAFHSTLNAFSVSSTLHLIGHDLECEVSSRPIDRLIGGRAGIGFTSDGSRTEAIVRLKFDF